MSAHRNMTYLEQLEERLSLAEEYLLTTSQSFTALNTRLTTAEKNEHKADTRLEYWDAILYWCRNEPQIIKGAVLRARKCQEEVRNAEIDLADFQCKYEEALQEVRTVNLLIADFMAQNPGMKRPSQMTLQELLDMWREDMAAAFADYSRMESFPTPPALGPCSSTIACGAETRMLKPCRCQIRHAFTTTNIQNLKMERLRWHPDRFAKAPEEVREYCQKAANEIFIVVDRMYREQLDDE